MMKKRVLLLVTFFLSYDSIGSELAPTFPYEECNVWNQEYTQQITEHAKSFSPDCQFAPPSPTSLFSLDSNLENCDYVRSRRINNAQSILEPICQNTHQKPHWHIPNICFHSSMLRGRKNRSAGKKNFYSCGSIYGHPSPNRTMNFFCSPNSDKKNDCSLKKSGPYQQSRSVYPRSFCINKDYVDMTAKAFNKVADCFELSPQERQIAFATYNHESSFLLNNRSHSNAKCYGQLTKPRWQDLNKYIYARNHISEYNWPVEANIVQNAFKNCPYLTQKVIPQKILNPKGRVLSIDDVQDISSSISRSGFTCASTHDPYVCLFYSMFSLKTHLQLFSLEDVEQIRKPYIDDKITNSFSTALNEIRIINGTLYNQDKNQISIQNHIIKNLDEAEHFFYENKNQCDECETCLETCKQGQPDIDEDETTCYSQCYRRFYYDQNNLTITPIEIFDSELLKAHFVSTAHNGGSLVVSKDVVKSFLNHLKHHISCPKDHPTCSSKTPICKNCEQYKNQLIQTKQPLDSKILHQEWVRFVDYLEEEEDNNGDDDFQVFSNPSEVKPFFSKVMRDHQNTLNINPNRLQIEGFDLKTPFTDDLKQSTQEFSDSVQKQCQFNGIY